MTTRTLQRAIVAIPTSDGAGVKLRRSLGQSAWSRLDPFLMLDHFSTENADDYIAGFPAHPHRGFETVTYMLDGHMRHEDHLGNQGDLGPGDVQWMTAAHGIIHSEMPQVRLPHGGEVKVIAGTLKLDGNAVSGPVNGSGAKLSTDPLYLDVRLP